MEENILTSIKKLIGGIHESDTSFDLDIIFGINTAFSILYQLGVGDPSFRVETGDEVWSDYLSDYRGLEMIKQYIALQVRVLFDPPSSSSALESLKSKISELEWRINVVMDPVNENALRS